MSGVLVASAVVTLMHWLRVHDRRLLPLMFMFAMMAAEQSLEWWHPWKYSFEMAAAGSGLVLMGMLRGDRGDTPGAPAR